MFFHPQLLPATLGAIAGIVVLGWAAWRLSRRWSTLSSRKRWIVVTALSLFEIVYWLNIYAWFIEPRQLVVRQVEIVSEEWHGAPLRLAVLGDTHVGGPHVDSARMLSIVRRVNTLRPDLVVLLGDYANGHATEAQRTPAENQEIIGGIGTFAALTARYGVVAVIGNHDVWYSREAVTTALQAAGAAVLWNRNITINRSGGQFVVAGLEDDMTSHPDFAEALDGAPRADTIILSHSPDPFAEMPHGPALMLAGHGHCGQVTIPFIGRPILPLRNKRYACHIVRENGNTMYVTAGIGTSIAPVRFLNPPEIVLITIRAAGAQNSEETIGG